MNDYNLTMVSGFWNVKNKHDNHFYDWFDRTLKINCPYVIFCDDESLPIIQEHRKSLPTHYIVCNIPDFYTCTFKDTIQPHPRHCPSKELSMIWNEKVFFVKKASDINIFNTEYFAWVDAGICIYRDSAPPTDVFPSPGKVSGLPKDKFIFTSSNTVFQKEFVERGIYYHFISAGIFIMHKSFIDEFTDLYKQYIDYLLPKGNWIYTEQVVFTIMYYNMPQLFHRMADGYGNIIPLLY